MRRGKPAGESPPLSVADQKPKREFLRKEGWLDKLSPRSVVKDIWQKRWVVLAEGEMCYYKEPDSSPLGVVPLSHVEKITGVGNRVILSMNPQYSSREWKWRADTAHDAEQWRDALEQVRADATSASEVVTRYSESGATQGKYWKRLDPAFKQQSLMAGRSHRNASISHGAGEPAADSSTKLPPLEEEVIEDASAPRWARKRGASQIERPKEVLYMEGMLTKLNKGIGQSERFYVLNGNKMTGYKNARQEERASTWFMEQLTSIEVVKTDGRTMLSLELNGVEQYELVGRNEDEIRQWAAKLASAHVQFGGVLNISDLLHGSSKKSALYKQLEAQDVGQQSGTAIDMWCSNFDDKLGKDLKSFLETTPSIDAGLFTLMEAQLLPGTDITKHVMQSLHDCLYGVIVHFIDDWQMQPPALIVALLDWLFSYYLRLKRMGVVGIYPDLMNSPAASEMIDQTCPLVSGPLLLPKSSASGKTKFAKQWFSMKGSLLKSFESSEQEDAGAPPLQIFSISRVVSVEREGKQLKLFFPKETSAKKSTAANPEVDLSGGRFPPAFVADLIKRLVREKEDGTLPFDGQRPFPGYELVEWICSINDLSHKVKRRDVSQGLAQSLIVNGAVARSDGGADWDEDADYMFPFVEEEDLQELELVTEREDSAIRWQAAIDCVRRAITDKSRRRYGTGTPEIKTRFENEGQSVILDEVQSTAIEVFQKCDDLADYLVGSQKLMDHAASYLDDLMFEEEFKACFDFVFDSFFTKAFSVIVNYCKENYHHWRQFEFISLATWASSLEGRVLQYDESKLDLFNVVDQEFFVDLMDVYNQTISQEIQRLVMNLVSEDIKAKSEPLLSSEGHLKSLAIVDLMAIYNQSLSLVIGTGNAVVVTSTIKYTLSVLELFPKTYLQKMQANASTLPIEHVVSVLNAFYEGSHCIQALEDQLRTIIPEKFFEELSFDGPSAAFNRAWKDGAKIVVQVVGADTCPILQKIGDKSWLNGSVTANWLATVRDYFIDLNCWMIPAVFRKLASDTFDNNLRLYVKALLGAKLNVDDAFLERTDADIDMIKEVFVEFTRINLVSSRIGLFTELLELLACDYDDVRRGFMSMILSSDMHIGVLEKVPGHANLSLFDLLLNLSQILELRDCKRSVKKEILEECRVSWQEPEASDDEATYALVTSGVEFHQIPSGSEKFSMFSECAVTGIWPDWKERRDKERKDRFAALKSRKESNALQQKERERIADKERREASMAVHRKAVEDAKRIAKERALEAEASKVLRAKSAPASTDVGKSSSSASGSGSRGETNTKSQPKQNRTSVDMSLSEIRALRKAVDDKRSATDDTASKGDHEHDVQLNGADSKVGSALNLSSHEISESRADHSQSNSGGSGPVKETMKEKIARQKREAELAKSPNIALAAGDAFHKVVQEAVRESSGAEGSSGKETLKEKIARQKREAELAASAASTSSPSTPTLSSLDSDSKSDSGAPKETLKEKIARQKREAEAAALGPASASPAFASPPADVDELRPDAVKETLKEKIARQKLEAELAAMSTSDAGPESPPLGTRQQSNSAESSSGKETLKEKIARQKREAELATSTGSPAVPSTPRSASFDAGDSMPPVSDSSSGKETLKEKIARAKREAELASSSPSTNSPISSAAVPDSAPFEDGRPRSSSNLSKETLKERIARQKQDSQSPKTPTANSGVSSPPQPVVSSAIIGGLAAKRGATAFIRSIQRPPGNS